MIQLVKLLSGPVTPAATDPGIAAAVMLPLISGIMLFSVPERFRTVKGVLALIISIITAYFTVIICMAGNHLTFLDEIISDRNRPGFIADLLEDADRYAIFNIDNLSRLVIPFISLFAILILLYSIVYIRDGRIRNYYPYFLITLGCSYGAVLSDNLLVFLFFWGMLGITLYKLIQSDNEASSATAKKTLILIGASDSIMIIGIAILWKLTGSLSMNSIRLPADNALTVTAFLLLLTGSFTKAGAFPFHTWVPDYSKDAPASSSAFMPASLDKLLGIYFFSRMVNGIFIPGEWMTLFLLTIGVITIITAVMMALVQHNYKKLLGYHAVSQVGYMIVGFSLGSQIGIAAGLFHMLNNALYKSGLFLSAGCIEYRTGREEIGDLGGLAKPMPVTFLATLIFAMSISGIPPFNGFASKWMIYQGIIDFGSGGGVANRLWVLWLGLTVLGSALTLASFVKFTGGIFLGRYNESSSVKEVPPLMWVPVAILALLCIFFGVFSTKLIVPELLMPVTGNFGFTGFWNSGFVSLLVLLSIALGIILYLISGIKRYRRAESFIGGEKIHDQTGYPAQEFYKTIGEFRFFSFMYEKALTKWFDLYDLSKQFVLWLSRKFSNAHSGVLTGYIIWVFAGLIIMLLIMI
jgi:formate hydrogenlyase subunit 3/multisubunit Na+/H+ antiporter MnhD subunit